MHGSETTAGRLKSPLHKLEFFVQFTKNPEENFRSLTKVGLSVGVSYNNKTIETYN